MHKRNHNILDRANPPASVRAVITCAGPQCVRTVVEYRGGLPATHHSQGLPEDVQLALVGHAPTIETNCNHHGGDLYNPATAQVLLQAHQESSHE